MSKRKSVQMRVYEALDKAVTIAYDDDSMSIPEFRRLLSVRESAFRNLSEADRNANFVGGAK